MTEVFTPEQAIAAIEARIQGVFDAPQLLRLGPLGWQEDDILRIIEQTRGSRVSPITEPLTREELRRQAEANEGAIKAVIEVDLDELLDGNIEVLNEIADEAIRGDAVGCLGELNYRIVGHRHAPGDEEFSLGYIWLEVEADVDMDRLSDEDEDEES